MDTSVMKINAVVNRCNNPNFENGGQYWYNNFGGPTAWARTNFPSGGHDNAPYVRLTALSPRGYVSSNDRMYIASSPFRQAIKPGDSLFVSYYVRCSVPITLTPSTEFFINNVNLGNAAGTTPTSTSIPANEWTLVSSLITPSNPSANQFTVTTYGRINETIPIGGTLDYCKVLYVAGGHPTDYFDGNSPNCKWLGTPNNSASLKPELRDAPVMVNMRANKARDPQFKLPITAFWNINTTIGNFSTNQTLPSPLEGVESSIRITTTNATAGSFMLFGGQPITKIKHTLSYYVYHNHSSSIDFSVRRNGANASPITVPPGTWTRISDTANLDPGINANYGASIMTTVPSGVVIWITGYLAEITDSLLAYFDGNTSGAKWLGTPDNSISVIPQLKEAHPLIMTTDGLKPV